jgi:hypothetical protein
MINRPVTTFGKRGQPAPARSGVAAPSRRAAVNPLEATESGVPLSVLAATLMDKPTAEAQVRRDDGIVPKSWRAGLLAGLVASLIQAGMVMVGAKTHSASLSGLGSLIGIDPQAMTPLVLAGSVFDGAQTVGFTVLLAHRVLKRHAITSYAAYALGGGAAAAICAAAWSLIGFGGPEHGWVVEIATGLAAGYFYRLFAGANPF